MHVCTHVDAAVQFNLSVFQVFSMVVKELISTPLSAFGPELQCLLVDCHSRDGVCIGSANH